ncbi:HAD family hydrolase [Nocardioides aurantiacus]|uniref:HAD family hydrolase n=1 Tax=Nocardioides aurantiacus TaxID=86796 RepID=UPI00403EFC15
MTDPAPAGVRLVATDLDGTLLRTDGTLSPRTVTALADARAAGLDVVFVTGRPLRWAAQVFDHVGGHGLAIAANGALLWDVGADRARLVRALDPAAALEVGQRIRAAVPGTMLAVETVDGFGLEPDYLPGHPLTQDARRGAFEELVDAPVLKLLVRREGVVADDYAAEVVAATDGLATVTWSSSGSLLELSAPGVTKASTLELLCVELGIDRDAVVAFGDMPNDLAMLRWVGTSYAMANAHPAVLDAADRVAPTNDEDGVAQVIEQILAGDVGDVEDDGLVPSQG